MLSRCVARSPISDCFGFTMNRFVDEGVHALWDVYDVVRPNCGHMESSPCEKVFLCSVYFRERNLSTAWFCCCYECRVSTCEFHMWLHLALGCNNLLVLVATPAPVT